MQARSKTENSAQRIKADLWMVDARFRAQKRNKEISDV